MKSLSEAALYVFVAYRHLLEVFFTVTETLI